VLVGRTLAFQLLTAGVTVALARLLTPADYGLFAIALSVQLVGQNLTELGLPAALVRMPEAPPLRLQASTIGFLLLVTASVVVTVSVTTFAIVPALGGSSDVLAVVAITLLALPIYASRAVPMAMMDRQMRFGRVAAVEAADTVGFNLFALSAALAGLGAFSLAGAVPFGAALGATIALSMRDVARRPRLELALVKPLIGFGSRVSLLGVLHLGRDLGYVTIVGAVGGTAMAGFYGMAKRLFSFPTALAAAVTRVALPTLSQSGEQRSGRTASMIGQIAFVCGLPLALVAGAVQPLIEIVLGSEWLPTADIVLFGSLSMLIFAGLCSPINSYCLAEGRPNPPLAAIAAELLVGFLLAAALIGGLEESGIGIAMSAGTIAAAAVLLAATSGTVRGGATRVARVVAISAVAAAVGQLLPVADDTAGLAVSLLAVGLSWLVLATLLLRAELAQVATMVRSLLPGSGG
jgi:O-antigen/teichoic acid export membrane protein